jgi:hypothetical protein
LNNLFSKTEDYKARLDIDSSKFREQFNSKDKRTTYLNTLYEWLTLKMLNTVETTTTSSVYEKYIDVVKFSSEDFVNALFLFTIAFQVLMKMFYIRTESISTIKCAKSSSLLLVKYMWKYTRQSTLNLSSILKFTFFIFLFL